MKPILSAVAALAALVSAAAGAEPVVAKNVQWHFPVHLSYVSGLSDIMDTVSRDFDADDEIKIPVGLSFQPYAQFSNGVGIGFDVGPIALVGVSFSDDGEWDFDDSEYSLLVPLGVFVRYEFLREGTATPYIRGGVRKVFTSGDLIDGGSVGAYGCVGIEFNRDRKVHFGFEAGFDSCTVDVHPVTYWGGISDASEEVKPYGFMASVFVSF